MSSEAKRVKLFVLVELIVGLCLIAYGALLAIGGVMAGYSSLMLAGEGVLGLVFGVRGALIANVPARIGKLAAFALVVLVVQLVCVAGIVCAAGPEQVGGDPVAVVLGLVPAVISCVVLVLSRGMAKRAER